MLERAGDFRDWRDASGNLIPIYDPLTIRPDGQGGFTKDQFMGCDGNTPNVICPNRISSLVRPWLAALPTPTGGGPLNNYLGPAIPDTILGNSDYYMGRFDLQIKSTDHIFMSVWHQRAPAKFVSVLPQSIASESYSDPQNSWVSRLNWDRTFSSTLLNHMSMGYLNRNEGYGSVNQSFVDDFPQIAGVAGYNVPPQMSFSDGFAQFGSNAGVNIGNVTTRPTFIINDSLTWTKGAHTLKAGMEYRKIMGNIHGNGNQAGSFTFGRGSTGLLGVNSGSPIASFLLGAVDSANSTFRAVDSAYPRQNAWILFAGDTWSVTDKLTLDYGLRWDYYSPSSEKYDRFSFFDPVGPNPGAGGRPGRLAFAGDEFGAASYGARYPEEDFYGGFAPRFGAVYRFTDKTVLRSGWGIFYTQAFYPGWGGGISQDGFSTTPSFNTSLGGIQPAFFLEQGLPQNFERPPLIESDFRNGQGILYRPIDANKRPYSHQWNITVDRELGRNVVLSVGYVGSAGRRLPSSIDPINAIDPSYLSMGDRLYDEFTPGMTSLHGVPLPYPGWVEQMTGCAPSVAQALRPFPQYCDNLQGLNENHGSSHYNSLQVKLEKRFSNGIYGLVSYTLSKTISSASDNTQRDAVTWSGLQGVISPFEAERNEVIAATDTPHVLSAAFVYELPVGQGRKVHGPGRRHERAARWLAGEHDLQVLVGTPHVLPLQGTATCRAHFAPDASRRSSTRIRSSHRTKAASTRARVRCSTRTHSSPCRRSTSTTGRATGSRKRYAHSAITTRISRSSRTRGSPAAPISRSVSRSSTSGTGTCSAQPRAITAWPSTTTWRARISADGTDRSPSRARCSSPRGSSSSAGAAPLSAGSSVPAGACGRSGPAGPAAGAGGAVQRRCRGAGGRPARPCRSRVPRRHSCRRRSRLRPAQPRHRPAAARQARGCARRVPRGVPSRPVFGAAHLLAGASLLALGQPRAALTELGRARD